MRFVDYIHAVSKEAELREDGHVLQPDSYAILRRENCGVQPFFALIEYVHNIDLPDEVFENPAFMRMYWQGVDLVWLSNASRSPACYFIDGLTCATGPLFL